MGVPQSIPGKERTSNEVPTCVELMAMAQRELGAFLSAVTELFDPEQAQLSAEDWLDELESVDSLPGLACDEWRRITIAAAARLASRLMDPANKTGVRADPHQSIDQHLRPIDSPPCFWPNGNGTSHPNQSDTRNANL
jgi:hypothetical protein